jgi:hypothetical protein
MVVNTGDSRDATTGRRHTVARTDAATGALLVAGDLVEASVTVSETDTGNVAVLA